MPERIGQLDRLVGSTMRLQTYDVWVLRTTHRSRLESTAVIYKMVNMRLPGEAAEGLIFREPELRYQVVVVQYSVTWEEPLLKFLEINKDTVDIVPG